MLSTAARIASGDFGSWTAQWLATARRVHRVADGCRERGHVVSAREAYLRAANYYRAAEFYLHGDPADPRIRQLSRQARSCFRAALALFQRNVEALAIPYEGTTLPGYYYPAAGAAERAATLIVHTGFDGTQEELRATALAANARGMHCVTFEGPGQGAVIREQGLPFRADWEAVVTPVLDHVLTLPGVDPDRIALLGLSFGGYLAPRAAAFEHRLAACIANGGILDFMANNLPAGMTRQAAVAWIREQPQAADQLIRDLMSANTDTRWAVQNGMFTFGAPSPGAWFLAALDYTLQGIAQQIRCPTLVIDTEAERAFKGQAKGAYASRVSPRYPARNPARASRSASVKTGWIVASAVDGAAVVIGHLPAGLRPRRLGQLPDPSDKADAQVNRVGRSHHVANRRKQEKCQLPRKAPDLPNICVRC